MRNDEERLLFLSEMADVRPLRPDSGVAAPRKIPSTPGQIYRREAAQRFDESDRDILSMCLRYALHRDDWLSFKRGGVQDGVFRKLRQGRYPVEATLDLQQSPPARARDQLTAFITDCMTHDIRTCLIHFGRGGGSALVKSYVAQWLPELESVMAFHTAQRPHGGVMAVYVLLRKSERRRQENRERYGGRRTL